MIDKNKQLNLIMGGGKSNTGERDANDFYATNSEAILAAENMFKEIGLYKNVWECACGVGNISEALGYLGYNVKSSDKIDRDYGKVIDFLTYSNDNMNCDIVTNPPYKLAEEFILQALNVIRSGRLACFFVKIQFLESKRRKKLFEAHPPKFVYVYSERQGCAKNNLPEVYGWGGTWCFCWIIFQKDYEGETILRWI